MGRKSPDNKIIFHCPKYTKLSRRSALVLMIVDFLSFAFKGPDFLVAPPPTLTHTLSLSSVSSYIHMYVYSSRNFIDTDVSKDRLSYKPEVILISHSC